MAPSSLKNLDGYGIFTARDIEAGSTMLSGPDGPSIPVVDYNSGAWITTWKEYWWARGIPDHVSFEGDRVMDYQFGFGAMPNHHCILNSLKHQYPTTPYDDSLVNRTSDPGTGAFSYSMGREFTAIRDLEAGDEIFLNYGYCERGEGAGHEWTATIPMPADYEQAALIAWVFWQVPSHVNVDIQAPKGTSDFVAGLLPKSTSQLRAIVGSKEIGGPDDLIPLLAKHVGSTPRTPEWIRSHGMCLEHLVARKSQLPHAGQGGFAQHRIRKGEIIVPTPMIHIADKDVLGINDDNGKRIGWQLLLNYCFGHNESSILLCPETNALLVNHCSERKKECGPNGPNADYRWSTGWEPRSDDWRKMTVDEIAKQSGRGLSMEVVALRDIEPGEEVFMDYGVEWEKSWEEHVATWNPPPLQETPPYLFAKKANEQKEPLELLVTGDLRKISEHPYLFTGCQYWPTELDDDKAWNKKDPSWVDLEDNEILHKYGDDGSLYQGDYTTHWDRSHWPCTVIRQEEPGTYTVRVHQADWRSRRPWDKNNLPRFLTDYPRESIHYFVKPYESDQHLPGVFRHSIGIRDEIFPEQWKNRKQG